MDHANSEEDRNIMAKLSAKQRASAVRGELASPDGAVSGKARIARRSQSDQAGQTWQSAYEQWAHWFAIDAKKDKYSAFRDQDWALGLPGKPEPEDMLRATLLLVEACMVFRCGLDIQPHQAFLNLQVYDFEQAPDARYGMVFDMGRNHYGRLLTTPNLDYIDLADLYGYRWIPYKTVGFSYVWIFRLDEEDFTKSELHRLEKLISEDIRYDLSEEDVSISFDRVDAGVALLYACEPD
jgi:hypothetical protein